MRDAELPGASLRYQDSSGEGPPIVFLHAGSGSSRMWEHQVADFTGAGYRFVAYDRRAEGVAVDDLEALAGHLGLDRFHLVGTAAGGIVAVDYALGFPQRLRSLVVANSIVGVQDEEYLELTRSLRPAPQFNAIPAEIRELGPSYRAANPRGTQRWKELARGGHSTPQTTKNRITYAALEKIATPTLLLTGDADLYAPPPVLRLFAARFPNCESVVIPECGHSAFWEQPEAFNRAVLDFLSKH
ncbi:MAG TPA: alpha/beta hydrolase [Burkholderiales bacterium]|nr:alpha/beta hydrolase [Burkholderiales bacterium]